MEALLIVVDGPLREKVFLKTAHGVDVLEESRVDLKVSQGDLKSF